MMPYKKMGEDCLIAKDPETPKGQTAIPPTVMVVPGSQTTNPAQSQVVVVMSPSQMELSDKRAKILLGLGATQLIIGILEVLFNIGAHVMFAHVFHYTGAGYWCGAFTILTGAFGIAASKRKGRCLVLTFMVFSIITTVLTGILIIMSMFGIADAAYSCYYFGHHWKGSDCRAAIMAARAWSSLMLIAGVIEFVISIVSAALSCYNLCGKSRPTVISPGVQYVNSAQQLNMDTQPQVQVLSK